MTVEEKEKNTIGQMPINTAGKLSESVKKHLMNIIDKEFCNKASLFHQVKEQEKIKILEAYRLQVKYPDWKKRYEVLINKGSEIDRKVEEAKDEMQKQGLDIYGELDCHNMKVNGRWVSNPVAEQLSAKLSIVEANAPTENLKSKLVARLMLSSTIGEANMIMREVLGNGIMPVTDVKAITFTG